MTRIKHGTTYRLRVIVPGSDTEIYIHLAKNALNNDHGNRTVTKITCFFIFIKYNISLYDIYDIYGNYDLQYAFKT